MSRVYNFSAGPATLPSTVLERARDELLDFQGLGMSIAEISHRDAAYMAVHQAAIDGMRRLLGLSDDYAVLFLQGGATGQFAMIPMNLLPTESVADYVNSGSWAEKAIAEARAVGTVHVAADTSQDHPGRMPNPEEIETSADAAYLHITSNETIGGVQWKTFPRSSAPLVVDMSSDILSRPFDASAFDLIYAGAQKNLSIAGVTMVAIRNDLLDRAPATVPPVLRYATHAAANSMSNTPPCFAIYLTSLVVEWIETLGLERLYRQNAEKAAKVYAAIDATGFYTGAADVACRSDMNITFNLPNEALEKDFVAKAAANDMHGLKGHRSVGGIRASVYNAFPVEGVDALVAFMKEFERVNG